MTLDEACELAAAELPKGYSLNIWVEKNSAYLELYSDYMTRIHAIDGADMSLAEQVLAAVAMAKEDANIKSRI